MHLVFYIGLGIGFGVAAGLRPFLPALLAGALGSAGALGVGFAHGRYHFLQSAWWLLAVTVALAISYALQLRIGVERFEVGPFAAAVAGIGIGVGALLFAGTLSQHGDASWPGLIGGAAAALLGQTTVRPLLSRARTRLPDREAREALTVYADGVALVLGVLVAVLHPLGYVAFALLLWLAVASRRRAGEKYAGLRILGR
jgi:Domain of unknown function (DUF4126)